MVFNCPIIVGVNEEFKTYYYNHLKYFTSHDLIVNRHYGALTQIDQYITYKKIPVIHCTLPRSIPTWFKFSSGIVDTEITKFQYSNSEYYCSHAKVNNAINELGNYVGENMQLIRSKTVPQQPSFHEGPLLDCQFIVT